RRSRQSLTIAVSGRASEARVQARSVASAPLRPFPRGSRRPLFINWSFYEQFAASQIVASRPIMVNCFVDCPVGTVQPTEMGGLRLKRCPQIHIEKQCRAWDDRAFGAKCV